MNVTNYVASDLVFVGLGAAEFYLRIYPETFVKGFVSIFSYLYRPLKKRKLPLNVNSTFELVNNEHGVIDTASFSESYTYIGQSWGKDRHFNYSSVEQLIKEHRCVTFKYRVGYTF
jgi:hypothetical protein